MTKMMDARYKLLFAWVTMISFLVSTNAAYANGMHALGGQDTVGGAGAGHQRLNGVRSPYQLVDRKPAGESGGRHSMGGQPRHNNIHIQPVNQAGSSAPRNGEAINKHYFNRHNNVGGIHVPNNMRLQNTLTNNLPPAVKLDLSSDVQAVTLTDAMLRHQDAITISENGSEKTFHAGDKMTAAEYIAVQQSSKGEQTIVLDSSGRANGGTLSLNSISTRGSPLNVTELVVPKAVTAFDSFSRKADFSLSGDLINYGTIIGVAKNPRVLSGTIAADSITNAEDAIMSTMLAKSPKRFDGAAPSVDFVLQAMKDINNSGELSSSGSLTLNAGGTINNNGSNASIQAVKDVNLSAPNLVNAGSIASSGGNVTLGSNVNAAVSVNNAGGQISANAGAINVREDGYAGAHSTTVTGGDLLSQNLNINAGQGTTNVDVKELTGLVHGKGKAAHVTASTDNLQIGSTCFTGDPTFYNDAGDVTLSSDINVGEVLSVVASGSVYSSANIQAGDNSTGYDINIIAGANITNTSPDVTVDGASATGGNVQMSGIISTKATSASGDLNSGNLLIAAYADGGGNNGMVDLTGSTIDTTSTNNGSNGNVTVIAGSSYDAIRGSGINTQGAGSAGGTVSLIAAQPTTSDGQAISFAANGSISSGNQIVAGALSNGSIDTGFINARGDTNITTNGTVAIHNITSSGNVNVSAGNIENSDDISIYANNVNLAAAGNFQTTPFHFSSININAIDNITINAGYGVLRTYGGDVTLSANSDIDLGTMDIDTSTAFTNGNGGDVTITSNGVNESFVLRMHDIIANGDGSGFGGDVTVQAHTPQVFRIGEGGSVHGVTSHGGEGGTFTFRNYGPGGLEVVGSPIDVTGPLRGGNITFDNVAGNLNFTGGSLIQTNGGFINIVSDSVTATGSLALDASIQNSYPGGIYIYTYEGGLSTNGNDFTATSGGDINVHVGNGVFTTSGAGNSGNVSITSTDYGNGTGITIDAPINTAAANSGFNGGNVSLNVLNTGYINVGNILASGNGSGNGGNVTLTGDFPTVNVGDIIADGGASGSGGNVTANFMTDFTLQNVYARGGDGGNGGSFSIISPLTSNVNLNGMVDVSSTNGDGGNVTMNIAGQLAINSQFVFARGGGNGNGGHIDITAASIAITGGGHGSFNADALDNGNGGTVSLTTTDQSNGDIYLGTNPTYYSVVARGGSSSGDGGTISLSAAKDLILTGLDFAVGPQSSNGNGGNLNFTATNSFGAAVPISVDGVGNGNGGNLTITASGIGFPEVSANGAGTGSGGNITLTADGIGGGGVTVNGANGHIIVTNNQFFDTNSLHLSTSGTNNSITINTSSSIQVSNDVVANGVNSSITMNSGGEITQLSGFGVLTTTGEGSHIVLNSNGNIGTSNANRLQVNTPGLSFHTNGGNAFIDDSANGVTLGASAASNLNVRAAGTITVSGVLSGNSVTLATYSNNGSIIVNDDIISTNNVTLNANGSGNILTGTTVQSAFSVGWNPTGVAMSPNGQYAYICSRGFNYVAVIDTATNMVVDTIGVGGDPEGITVSSNGAYAYVVNQGGYTVNVLDLGTRTAISQVSVGNKPVAATINPAGNLLYVSNENSNDISVVNITDPYNPTVVTTIGGLNDPGNIAFSTNGKYAYVANIQGGSVAVIDTTTNNVISTIGVGSTPAGVSANPFNNTIYVGNVGSNTVSVIDTRTNTVTATINVGNEPRGISVNPTGTLVYVGNVDSVSIIDTSTNTVIDTVAHGNTSFNSYGNFSGFVNNAPRAYVSTVNNDGAMSLHTALISASNSITLTSGSGNINVATSSANLTANTNGNVAVTSSNEVNLNSSHAGGNFAVGSMSNIYLNGPLSADRASLQSATAQISINSDINAASGVALSAGNGITVVDSTTIAASNGSISLRTMESVINIGSSSNLSATEGNVILQSYDTDSGAINIGAYTTISATTTGSNLGRVYLVLGDIPSSPVLGTAPANVDVNTLNSGQVYFGDNSIAANAPTNTITADGGVVVFNTGSFPDSAINLGGGVTINSTATAGYSLTLDSLDLTDSSVVNHVLWLQSQGYVGGTLVVDGGVAIGGNLILDPTDLASLLTAENIPVNVIATFTGFGNSNYVTIDLTGSSTTSQVLIGGTHEFVGAGSFGQLVITSSNAGPALNILSTGFLTGENNLSVSAPQIHNAGNITANGDISLQAESSMTLHNVTGGTVSATVNSGTLTFDNAALTATIGNINVSANNVDVVNGALNVSAIGNATFATTSVITGGNDVNVVAAGSISIADIDTSATNAGNVLLSAGTDLNAGDIVAVGTDVSGGNITISAGSNLNAGLITSVGLDTADAGNLTIDAGGNVVVESLNASSQWRDGGNIYVEANQLAVTGTVPSSPISIYTAAQAGKAGDLTILLNSTNAFTIGGGGGTGNGIEGTLDFTAPIGATVLITAGGIVVNQSLNNNGSNGSFKFIASSGDIVNNNGSVISANAVTFSSTFGNVGASGQTMITDSNYLTSNADGSSFIYSNREVTLTNDGDLYNCAWHGTWALASDHSILEGNGTISADRIVLWSNSGQIGTPGFGISVGATTYHGTVLLTLAAHNTVTAFNQTIGPVLLSKFEDGIHQLTGSGGGDITNNTVTGLWALSSDGAIEQGDDSVITGPAVTIWSNAGHIGSEEQSILVSGVSGTVDLTLAANQYIYAHSNSSVNLVDLPDGLNYIRSYGPGSGDITNNTGFGPYTLTANGSINIHNNVDVGFYGSAAITLDTTSGSGSITSSGGTLMADTVILTTNGFDIGSETATIVTDAANLHASTSQIAGTSSVYITDTNAAGVSMFGANIAGYNFGKFFLHATGSTGNITTTADGTVSGGLTVLVTDNGDIGQAPTAGDWSNALQTNNQGTSRTLSAVNGNVYMYSHQSTNFVDATIDGNLYANTALGNFFTKDDSDITDGFFWGGGVITGNNVLLQSGNNITQVLGGYGALSINLVGPDQTLTLHAGGSVIVNVSSNANLISQVGLQNTVNPVGSYNLNATGNINVVDNLFGGLAINLASTNGDMNISASLAATNQVNLNAGAGNIGMGNSSFISTDTLSMTTNGGNIGSGSNNIITNAANLHASTTVMGGTGAVYVTDTNDAGVSLFGENIAGFGSADGKFFLNATGSTGNVNTAPGGTVSAGITVIHTDNGDIGQMPLGPDDWSNALQITGQGTGRVLSATNGSVYFRSHEQGSNFVDVTVDGTTYSNTALHNYFVWEGSYMANSEDAVITANKIILKGGDITHAIFNPNALAVNLSGPDQLLTVSGGIVNVSVLSSANLVSQIGLSNVGNSNYTISAAGNLNVVGNVSSGNVTLNSAGTLSFVGSTISATSGHVTATGIDVNVSGGALNLNAPGNVTVATTSGGIITTGNNVNVNAGNNITMANLDTGSSIDGGNITMFAGGSISAGDLYAIGHVNTGGNITLFAGGNINAGHTSDVGFDTADAGNMSINAGGNVVVMNLDTSSQYHDAGDIVVNANQLAVTSTRIGGPISIYTAAQAGKAGNLTINLASSNDFTIGGGGGSGNGVEGLLDFVAPIGATILIQAGGINLNTGLNNMGAGGSITLNTTSGDINLADNLSTGIVTVNATGGINQAAGQITVSSGGVITLWSQTGTGNGNIGSAAQRIHIGSTGGDYIFGAQTQGNVYVESANSFTFGTGVAGAGASNVFDVRTASGSNGSITLQGVQTAGTINLSADGSGSINNNGAFEDANTLSLTTGGGSIGSESSSVLTNAANLHASTTEIAGTGSVFITDNNNDGVAMFGANIAGYNFGKFFLHATGSTGTITTAPGGTVSGGLTVLVSDNGDIGQAPTAGDWSNALQANNQGTSRTLSAVNGNVYMYSYQSTNFVDATIDGVTYANTAQGNFFTRDNSDITDGFYWGGGVITGNNVLLQSGNNITQVYGGSGALPIHLVGPNQTLTLHAGGSVIVNVDSNANLISQLGLDNTVNPVGSYNLNAAGNLTVQNSLSGGLAINLVSTGNMEVASDLIAAQVHLNAGGSMAVNGDIIANAGSITLTNGSGALTVGSNAILSATEGNVILQNTDTVGGSISIGSDASISATTTGSELGRVYLVIGEIPSSPTAGSTPANVSLSLLNGGQAYFGDNSFTADAPTNTITADGGVVIINTGSLAASTINLGGGVTINSTAAPQYTTTLDSLDLTDASVVSHIVWLQQQGYVGGTLIVDGGIAVGGDLIIDPTDLANLLTAEYIPVNVSAYFQGFGASDYININLTASSSTQQVIIGGLHEFTGAGSIGQLLISSDVAGPALNILSTGNLNSANDLTVNAPGIESAGHITAAGNVTLQATTASIAMTSGNLSATSVVLQAAGDIGSESQNIQTNATNITANAGGSIYINDTTTGNVNLVNSGAITNTAGGTYFLNSDDSSRLYTGVGAVVSAANIVLHKTNGGIGDFSVAFFEVADGSNVTAQTDNGSSFIKSNGSVNFEDATINSTSYRNLATNTFYVIGQGGITTTSGSYIEAPFMALHELNGDINANVVTPNGGFTADNGNVDVFSNSNLTLRGLGGYAVFNAAAGHFNATSAGNINLQPFGTGTITAGDSVNLTGVSIYIEQFNAISTTNPGGSVTLTATAGNIGMANDSVINTDTLSMTTNGGNIGSEFSNIVTNAANLHASTTIMSGTGAVYVTDTNNAGVSLFGANIAGFGSADGKFFLNATGSVGNVNTASGGTVSAGITVIHTDNGDIGQLPLGPEDWSNALQITGQGTGRVLSATNGNVYFRSHDQGSNFVDVTIHGNTYSNTANGNYYAFDGSYMANSEDGVITANNIVLKGGDITHAIFNPNALTVNLVGPDQNLTVNTNGRANISVLSSANLVSQIGLTSVGAGTYTISSAGNLNVVGNVSSSSVSLSSSTSLSFVGSTISATAGNLTASGADVNVSGGALNLNASGHVSLTTTSGGIITTGNDVNVNAGSNITLANLDTSSSNDGGNITMFAGGSINAGDLYAIGQATTGGNISLTAGGNINAGHTSDVGFNTADAGNMTINAGGNVVVMNLDTSSQFHDAGDIVVNANQLAVTSTRIGGPISIYTAAQAGKAGNLTINLASSNAFTIGGGGASGNGVEGILDFVAPTGASINITAGGINVNTSLDNSGAGGTIALTATAGDINVNANLNTVNSITATAIGSINLAGNLTTSGSNSSVNLHANTGSLVTDGVSFIDTDNLTVFASGDIGSSLSIELATNASRLSAVSLTGDVHIRDSLNGVVTLDGANFADDYVLRLNFGNGAISLASGVVVEGTTSVALLASSGSITQVDNTAMILTQTLHMQTSGFFMNIGTSSQNILTNAAFITASGGEAPANGVFITDSNNGTVTLGSFTGGGTINLTASNGSIAVADNGLVRGRSNVNLIANGSITLGSNATIETTGGANTVTLTASGSGSIGQVDNTGLISTGTLNVSTAGGNIGTVANNLRTNAATLSANATSFGDINIVDHLNGLLTLTGSNIANNYNLRMGTGNGAINLASGQNLQGATSVSLITLAGSITQADNTAMISTPSLMMQTFGTFMTIGTSSQSIVTNASTLAASAGIGAGGGVWINDTRNGAVTLSGTNGGATYKLNMTNANGSIIVETGNAVNSNTLVDFTTSALTLNGDINAGSGTVAFHSEPGDAILVDGPSAPANTLAINGASFSRITAGTLAIGDTTNNNNLTVSGNINIPAGTPGTTAGVFNLSLAAGGTINGTAGNITTSTGRTVTMTAGGNINTGAISGGSNINVLSLNGNVTVDGNLSSSAIQLESHAANGLLTVNSGKTVAAPSITTFSNNLTINGALNAGTGNVYLHSWGHNIAVGGTTGPAGSMLITTADLNAITANTVQIGGTLADPNITINAALNVSGSRGVAAGAFNLSMIAIGNYVGTGQTITSGANTVAIGALGTVNTGSITSTTGNISAASGVNQLLTVDGALSNTGSAASIVLYSQGSMVANGTISSSTVNLSTANNGNITIGATVGKTTGTTNITANGSGTINVAGAGSYVIQGTDVNLASGTGAIGSTALRTGAKNLTVNTAGSSNIDNSAVTTVLTLGASNVGGTFNVLGGGDIKAAAAITAPVLTLTGGTNGAIIVNATIGSVTGTTTLNATGTGTITDNASGLVRGANVALNSNTGNINIHTSSPNITTSTTSSANSTIDNTAFVSTANLGTSSVAGTLKLTAGGALTTSGTVSASVVDLNGATNGNITVGGTLGSALGTTSISALGTGSINTSGSGLIRGSYVDLKAATGNIGTTALKTSATTLKINTNGNANIDNSAMTSAATIDSSDVNGTMSILAGGNISNTAAVTAGTLNLTTTNNGNITIGANFGSLTGNTTLTAGGSGTINMLSSGGTYTVRGNNLMLATGTGGIGTSSALRTTANTMTLTTGGSASATITNTGGMTLNNSIIGGTLTLTSQGAFNVNNVTTSNGSINLIATSNALNINANANLYAQNGNILIQNTGTGTGTIVIGNSADIYASSTTPGIGNVTIVIGAVPGSPVVGPTPANVSITTTGSGQVFFGTNGISTIGPVNNLLALDRNIIFSTGTRGANAIKLNGDVNITADPPADLAALMAARAAGLPFGNQPQTESTSVALSLEPNTAISGSTTATVMPSILTPHAQVQNLPSSSVLITQPAVLNTVNDGILQATSVTSSVQTTDATNLSLNAGSLPQGLASALQNATTTFMLDEETGNWSQPSVRDVAESCSEIACVVAAEQSMAMEEEATFTNGNFPTTIETVGNKKIKRTVLKQGNVLFVPFTDTVVETAIGNVELKAKSVALVMASSDKVSVFDLHDAHKASVVITFGKERFQLSPGTQVVLTKANATQFETINPIESIGYRNVSSRHLHSGVKAFASEFSIPTAINSIAPLKKMVTSKHPVASRISQQMLKTAAVVLQLGGAEYQAMPAPKMSAWR